jgi:hypothetical protein
MSDGRGVWKSTASDKCIVCHRPHPFKTGGQRYTARPRLYCDDRSCKTIAKRLRQGGKPSRLLLRVRELQEEINKLRRPYTLPENLEGWRALPDHIVRFPYGWLSADEVKHV